MQIAILGLGLIGGSLVRAIRRDPSTAGDWSVAAWTPGGLGPRAALAGSLIDAAPATVEATIEAAEMVVLAAPPLACLELLDHLAGPAREALREGATITDVASTKAAIVERADRLGLAFIGGHPMAGRELSGWEAGQADLFLGRPWVVVPGAHSGPADVERVERLARAAGAEPIPMAAADHDAAVAAVSHLPLVMATALVEAVIGSPGAAERDDWPAVAPLRASGWRDMTRLARGDPAMGAGIATTNAQAIATRLRALRERLDAWLAELDRDPPDAARLESWLRAAAGRLDEPRP